MRLNNGFEIPQIGVGTWTLRGETARQNVRLALQKDGIADRAPMDCATRPDYHPPRQAQPLQGESGHHDLLALRQ